MQLGRNTTAHFVALMFVAGPAAMNVLGGAVRALLSLSTFALRWSYRTIRFVYRAGELGVFFLSAPRYARRIGRFA